MLVLSQMFFTVFGSLANIFVFIILRDLPSLSSSTYNILLLNLTATNLIICTIVKPMSSVFVSYSFAEVIDKYCKTPPDICTWYDLPASDGERCVAGVLHSVLGPPLADSARLPPDPLHSVLAPVPQQPPS